MGNYVFAPWVGEKYLSDGYLGKKILVLGESHYGKEDEESDSTITRRVVEGFKAYKGGANYDNSMNSLNRFTNIFMGQPADKETALGFWDSILFYNYIQKLMKGPRGGTRPTAEDWGNSRQAFVELLNEYKPDVIIVWGKRLWNNITAIGRPGEEFLDGKCGKIYYYQTADKEIPALRLDHPSSPAFGYKYSEHLKAFIEQH
jgi:hypothetical protein